MFQIFDSIDIDIFSGSKMASPQIWNAHFSDIFMSWHFEASEDIMTKFKSQALHIIRIKYWNAGGKGFFSESEIRV